MSEGRDRLNRDEVEQERSPREGESRVSESEMGRSEAGDYVRYHVAGFWPRFFAYIIDLITIAAISFLLVRPILSLFNIETMPFWIGSTIVYIGVIGALYFILMTKFWGQTVGKIIFGLRVIRQDGKPLTWGNVLFREGFGRMLSQSFGFHIGYLWIAFHPRKQGWHDSLEDTFVIYEQQVAESKIVAIPRKIGTA